MLLIWRWICFYPGRPENTGENRPITNLKPRKPSQTPHSPVKNLKVFTRRLHFCLKLFDITTNKLSILLSVADFANHARFVFSWPAWVVCGFPIVAKGSKPHSHQSLLPGALPGGGERRRNYHNFGMQIFKCWAEIVMTASNQAFIPSSCRELQNLPKFLCRATGVRRVGGAGSGQILKNFRKNCPMCLGKLPNHRPAKLPIYFPHSGVKIRANWKFFRPLKTKDSRAPRVRAEYLSLLRRVATRSNSILHCVVPVCGVSSCAFALLCHNSLSQSNTLNAILWDSGKLFANVYL